jgi:hypothetical protein
MNEIIYLKEIGVHFWYYRKAFDEIYGLDFIIFICEVQKILNFGVIFGIENSTKLQKKILGAKLVS